MVHHRGHLPVPGPEEEGFHHYAWPPLGRYPCLLGPGCGVELFTVWIVVQATLLLLTLSYQVSYTHAGATLILLHNVSDIFLQATKLAVYAGSSMLDIAFFVCLCLSWLILRLGCLPVAIYNAVDQYVKASEEQRREATVGAPILIGLMASLVPMHVYWFVLFVMAAKKSLSGEKLRDTREDTDGEGHPPDVAGTKKTQ